MPYDSTRGVYQYIDEETNFSHQTSGHRAKQVLPRKDYNPAELARQARHQAREEARQRNRLAARTNASIPADEDYEDYNPADIDGNGDVWPPRMPTSTRRYNPQAWEQGNTRYEYRPQVVQTNIPPRRHAQQRPAERFTEGIPAANTGQRHRIHWLVFAGIGAILALTLWISAAWVNVWWTNTQNDWTYTQAFRTFSINKVVGHNNDSAAHPSHFIVQNDNRHIIIIELPANDVSKALIYSAPTLIGDGQDRTPVTISFQVNVQTGRLDMVLHVQDQTYVFTNNGTKFVAPATG